MRLVVGILLVLLSGLTSAAQLKDSNAAVALSDQVMRKASGGEIRGAFELARPYVVIPQSELDALLGQVELQLPVIAGRFGKSIGYELLRNDAAGESLMQTVYIHKFEKHAMVWRFIFYRTDKGWVLNSFKFDDDITSAF